MPFLNYFTGDLVPGQIFEGVNTESGWSGEVQYFADLPAASGVSGQVYLVNSETVGDWWTAYLNKKPAGLYQSNGSAWVRLPQNLYIYSLGDTNVTAANIGDLKIFGYNATNHVWEPKTAAELGVLPASGGTLTNVFETAPYEELTGDKTISFANGDVLYFYINPSGASVALTMPADPGPVSKSGVLWVKNNTGKAHTWGASPAIRFISETSAATPPTPAAAGYYTRYSCQWNDNNGGTGYWAVALAGKDTA